jgi:hypothetical protein
VVRAANPLHLTEDDTARAIGPLETAIARLIVAGNRQPDGNGATRGS